MPPSAKIKSKSEGIEPVRPSGTTPFLPCPLEGGGKWGGFCQVLVNNLQHPKNREPSPSRQCHDVVPSLNFCSPFPLSFLPVGALNPIPAAWGWGGICFTRGISTSVNKSLIKSHLSYSSQNDLICPKGKQKAIFPPPKKLQTSGAPWVSCGIFLLRAWPWGRRSRLRHRFPHPLCMFFVIHPPKKESKPGMDGTLMSFSPQSILEGCSASVYILHRSRDPPGRETHVLCRSRDIQPKF